MPKFNATWMPEALDWDFTGFPGFEATEKGTTPEPTSQQIRDFLRGLQMLEQAEDGAGAPDQRPIAYIRKLMDDGIEEKLAKETEQVAELVGEVCSSSPNADQFRRLPDVAKPLFLDYLIKNLINPNGRGAGSKESQAAPTNGASGTSSADTSAMA